MNRSSITSSNRRRRQEAALRAYIDTGSVKGAAHQLGLGERRLRQLLTEYCDANGYANVVQAAIHFHFGNSERGAEIGR